jgi:hypothetical protein
MLLDCAKMEHRSANRKDLGGERKKRKEQEGEKERGRTKLVSISPPLFVTTPLLRNRCLCLLVLSFPAFFFYFPPSIFIPLFHFQLPPCNPPTLRIEFGSQRVKTSPSVAFPQLDGSDIKAIIIHRGNGMSAHHRPGFSITAQSNSLLPFSKL